MRKDLDSNGLIYFSNKLKIYLSKKFKTLSDSISALSLKSDFDKAELENKINNSETKLSFEIDTVDNKVKDVDIEVVNIKNQVDKIDINCPQGDIINISNVQQYEFKNIKAGDIIEIENNGSDVILDCYSEFTKESSIDYKIINLNSSTKNLFTCDERFIEIGQDGLKPRDNIQLNYTKKTEIINGVTFDIYTSDVFSSELTAAIEEIVSIGEE